MSKSEFRPEIQGLRAIAVCMVALFHVWPFLIPGGYVGVDVFFVISGYLITGVLVREGERTGRINLTAFYMRRARRLLPMASLVLLLVGILTPFFLPASQWKDNVFEVLFSAFYLENWRLAAQAVDYLAADNAPSPVQHYWSLSIEEQFYILWPALIIAGLALARLSTMSPRAVLRAIFGVTTIASLAMSVWLTRNDPASAYFVTHTRIWELSLGGLVALWTPVLGEGARGLLGLAGIGAIVTSAFAFSTQTAFPGYAALPPTIGAVLVILSRDSKSPLSIFALLKTRPFQFLGDISYSLYLWHWPIIIFFARESGASIGLLEGLIILAASTGLAAASKVQVEDRFRYARPANSLRRNIAVLVVSLIAAPIVTFGGVYAGVARETALVAANPQDYPGAASLFDNVPIPSVASFAPPLALVKWDAPTGTKKCRLSFDGVEPVPCSLGDPKGRYKVFLIGDSHAEHWVPAFQKAALARGWNATSYTKSACPLFPAMLQRKGEPYEECMAWGRRMMQIIRQEKPDLVILGQANGQKAFNSGQEIDQTISSSLVRLWRDIEVMGPRVVAIADTPQWGERPDECLSRDPDCSVAYASIARIDPVIVAHQSYPRLPLLDFKDVVCPKGRCPAVIGNVVVLARPPASDGNLFAHHVDCLRTAAGRDDCHEMRSQRT